MARNIWREWHYALGRTLGLSPLGGRDATRSLCNYTVYSSLRYGMPGAMAGEHSGGAMAGEHSGLLRRTVIFCLTSLRSVSWFISLFII